MLTGNILAIPSPSLKSRLIKNFLSKKGLPLELWIVNPENGKILVGMLCGAKASAKWLELEHKRFIDCKEFPFDQETKIGLMRFYHQKQFCSVYNISKKDLERLRAIDRNEPVIGDDEAAALLAKESLKSLLKHFAKNITMNFAWW